MDMTGEQHIPASQMEVWDALNDTDVLAECIPGAESVERVSDTELNVALTAKFGPVKARFKGRGTLSDIDPPNSYTILFEGQGGTAGFGKGSTSIQLQPEEDGGTLLTYEVSATVGGKLAQIGSRLVNSAARKLANQFFGALVTHFGGEEEDEQGDGEQQTES